MVELDGNNCVFILSTPRAGSTLLAAMLGNHSQTYAPPESWLLLPLHSLFSQQAEIIDTYEHHLARIAWNQYMEHGVFDDAAGQFALSVYNALLQKSGKKIFIDKTPRYFHILPWLEQLFPNAKKIWLRRNPLDVIASCKSTWGTSIYEILGSPVSSITFDMTIGFSLLAQHFYEEKDTHHSVKYEDLVQDSTNTIATLCNFIGIPVEPEMLHYGSNLEMNDVYTKAPMGDKEVFRYTKPHVDSVMRWKKLLTSDEIRSIILTLGRKIFVHHGYERELDDAISWSKLADSQISENGNLESIFNAYFTYTDGSKPNSLGKEQTLIAKDNTRLRIQLSATEYNRAVLMSEVQRLAKLLEESEADRVARLAVVEEQGQKLGERDAERNNLRFQLDNLGQQFETSESDRAVRLAVIEEQGLKLGELEGERNNLRFQLDNLGQQFETSESDRAARLAVIEEQGLKLGESEGEQNNLRFQLENLGQQFEASETDRAARQAVIEEQGQKLGELEGEQNNLRFQLYDVRQKLDKREAICESQALVMEAQEHQIKIIMIQLGILQQALQAVQRSRVYKVLRWMGRWGWLDNLISHSLRS